MMIFISRGTCGAETEHKQKKEKEFIIKKKKKEKRNVNGEEETLGS